MSGKCSDVPVEPPIRVQYLSWGRSHAQVPEVARIAVFGIANRYRKSVYLVDVGVLQAPQYHCRPRGIALFLRSPIAIVDVSFCSPISKAETVRNDIRNERKLYRNLSAVPCALHDNEENSQLAIVRLLDYHYHRSTPTANKEIRCGVSLVCS
jgi:hypothetical protein